MEQQVKYFLVVTVPRPVSSIIQVLTVLRDHDVVLSHLESRSSRVKTNEASFNMDYFIEFCSPSAEFDISSLLSLLQPCVITVTLMSLFSPVTLPSKLDLKGTGVRIMPSLALYSDNKTTLPLSDSTPWFPRTISDVRQCCTALFKYGSDLTPDHPGYGDKEYQLRRQNIADVARKYEYGNPIPRIDYTAKEVETWGMVFSNQAKLYPSHACKEYNTHFPRLFSKCDYRENNIPQLDDVSRYLKAQTGWQLWPVIGWISARDFLNALAFRIFPTTQYIRHHSKPFYTPEPDICHELMGHAPLFCDPAFAQFSQEIGLASLGISDEWIDKLAALYWFTVEFGLVNEGGSPKAYGAGLLSGNEELQYCVTDRPERRPLSIEESMITKYPDTGLQPLYFVANSLKEMRDQMTAFAKSIPRAFHTSFDHVNQKVNIHPCSLDRY